MKANLIAFTKVNTPNENFDLNAALDFCAKMAGICYSQEGFSKLENEDPEATAKRLTRVLTSGHHSVFDHFKLTFELCNIPKIISMLLNNEKDYATSEKSARYTHFKELPSPQGELYEKWCEKLTPIIRDMYPNLLKPKAKDPEFQIKKLAQENARYFVSIFEPQTIMGYTVSLRQLNYLIYMFKDYVKNAEKNNFNDKLIPYINEFIKLFDDYVVEGLIPGGKNRRLSLFGEKEYFNIPDMFSYVYQTSYEASFSCVAQVQRHRTEPIFIYVLDEFKFYVPEIIKDDEALVSEWLQDADSLNDTFPQGTLVKVVQTGNIDTLILKGLERACGAAQLETMKHTVDILNKATEVSDFSSKIIEKTNNSTARCKFTGYKCSTPCIFGANQFNRKI